MLSLRRSIKGCIHQRNPYLFADKQEGDSIFEPVIVEVNYGRSETFEGRDEGGMFRVPLLLPLLLGRLLKLLETLSLGRLLLLLGLFHLLLFDRRLLNGLCWRLAHPLNQECDSEKQSNT